MHIIKFFACHLTLTQIQPETLRNVLFPGNSPLPILFWPVNFLFFSRFSTFFRFLMQSDMWKWKRFRSLYIWTMTLGNVKGNILSQLESNMKVWNGKHSLIRFIRPAGWMLPSACGASLHHCYSLLTLLRCFADFLPFLPKQKGSVKGWGRLIKI